MKLHKIKIAIVGTGKISKTLLDAFNKSGHYDVVLLHSRSLENAKKIAIKWKIPNYCNNLNDFKKYDLDFVYIASKTFAHYDQCKAILNQNINIICEKQMVLYSKQAVELFSLARKKELILFVAYKTIYMPTSQILINKLNQIKNFHTINISMFHKRDAEFKLKNGLRMPIEELYDMYYYPITFLCYWLNDKIDLNTLQAVFAKNNFAVNSLVNISFKTTNNILINLQIDYDNTSKIESVFSSDIYDIYVKRWSNMENIIFLNKQENKKENHNLILNNDYEYYIYELNFLAENYFKNNLSLFYKINKFDLQSIVITERIEKHNK